MDLNMEFNDIKKIWDVQNREPLYAINESALHRGIQKKLAQSLIRNNVNDVALTLISLGAAGYLSLFKQPLTLFDYATIGVLLFAVVYIWLTRFKRKKIESDFERSIIRDLDHAIANVQYEIRRSRTMVWWYIVPLAITALLNMAGAEPAWWQWVLIPGMFLLSWLVIQWGLTRHLVPEKERLERLREKLTEEAETISGE